jgi:hypothetical protein
MIRRGEYNIETIRDKNETIIIIQRGYYSIEIGIVVSFLSVDVYM